MIDRTPSELPIDCISLTSGQDDRDTYSLNQLPCLSPATSDPVSQELLERQHQLEVSSREEGAVAFRNRVAKAKAKGRMASSPAGVFLLKQIIEPFSTAIEAFQVEAATGRPGRKHKSLPYFRDTVDAPTMAYITAKMLLDCCHGVTERGPISLQSYALSVATGIEDEARFRAFSHECPKQYRKALDHFKRQGTRAVIHQRRVLVNQMNKIGFVWAAWPQQDKLHFGAKLIDLFIESTGLARLERIRYKPKDQIITLKFKQECLDFMEDHHNRSEILYPHYLPMLVPPADWTTVDDGGYIHNVLRPLTLVKTNNKTYMEELRNTEMPRVYEAINAMQRVPWVVNTPVLDVMLALWQQGGSVAGLPSSEPLSIPPKPHNIATDKEARYLWKREAAKTHNTNHKLLSKRLQTVKVMTVARMFKDEEAIYFPHQMDFRGRLYPVPMYFHPQGPDEAKALLLFAQGEPIVTKEALAWLAIHGANTYGVDNVSFTERKAWVFKHRQRILNTAEFPLDDLWWTEADSPWQFLAFCFEWAALARNPRHVSRLPVAMDGSCNGLQHFSAMLRDAVGGKATNLMSSEQPEDIYRRVAEKTTELLRAKVIQGGDEAVPARYALAMGIDRTVCKRPVMIMPYGGTKWACRRYLLEALIEKLQGMGENHPFSEDRQERGDAFHQMIKVLTPVVWQAIGEVVIAARSAMDWLQEAAQRAAAEGLPAVWRTPLGFPVLQAYAKLDRRRVKTKLCGALVYVSLATPTDEIDIRRQATGISPNFVHSLDATALMGTVCLAGRKGIRQFSMVHDSYGTVAAQAPALARTLREVFVSLYEENDVLDNLRSELLYLLPDGETLREVPDKGALELASVLDAEYFFA